MKKSLHERIFFLRILNVLFTILCHSWGADNRYDEVIGDPVIRSPMGIKQFIWTPKIYILPIPKIWCYRRTVPLNCLGTRKFNSTDGVDYRLICTLFWSFYFPFRCPEIQACISSVLWCDGVRHCPSGFDEEEANCSYRFGVTLLYVAVGAGALGIFLILLLATGCLKYCLYRHKARKKKKTVALSVNHLHVNHTHHNNGLTGSRLSGRYNLATPQEMYLENYGKDSICWQYAIADIETTVWIVRMLLPVFMFVFLLFVFLHSFFSKKHCENKKNNKKKKIEWKKKIRHCKEFHRLLVKIAVFVYRDSGPDESLRNVSIENKNVIGHGQWKKNDEMRIWVLTEGGLRPLMGTAGKIVERPVDDKTGWGWWRVDDKSSLVRGKIYETETRVRGARGDSGERREAETRRDGGSVQPWSRRFYQLFFFECQRGSLKGRLREEKRILKNEKEKKLATRFVEPRELRCRC